MDRCASCGATLTAGAGWCGQCFSAVTAAATPVSTFRPAAAIARPALQLPERTTRWGQTPTTFGPVGRVVATLLLLVPLVVMVVGGFVVMFSWGGAAAYAAIIVPWALRDIWRAGRIPLP